MAAGINHEKHAAEVVFIAVGTPPRSDGSADLSYVENVTHEIAKNMATGAASDAGAAAAASAAGAVCAALLSSPEENGQNADAVPQHSNTAQAAR